MNRENFKPFALSIPKRFRFNAVSLKSRRHYYEHPLSFGQQPRLSPFCANGCNPSVFGRAIDLTGINLQFHSAFLHSFGLIAFKSDPLILCGCINLASCINSLTNICALGGNLPIYVIKWSRQFEGHSPETKIKNVITINFSKNKYIFK